MGHCARRALTTEFPPTPRTLTHSGLDHRSLGDPMRAGKLFALASIEIDIDGVLIEIRGIRAVHVPPAATRIELPSFRDASGRSQAAIILPEAVRGPIGDAVLGQLVERGLAVKRPALTANSAGP